MDLEEMKREKAKMQQKLVDTAKAEKRDLNEEEQQQFETLQREIEELDKKKREMEKEQKEEKPEGANENPAEAERKRALDITLLSRDFGVDAEEYIRGGYSVDQVKDKILEQMREEKKPLHTQGKADISVTRDEQDKFRAAAADAMLLRSGMTLEKAEEGAKELRSMSLRDLAIECLTPESNGAALNRKSSDELFTMLQRSYFDPSAAFPAIMDTAINKAYVEGHKKANVTFDRFTKKGSLKDFKTVDNKYLAGPAGEFLEIPEGGEIKKDTYRDEKLPTRKLKTYGRQFTMSRQAFINDDIGVITKMPAKYATSARKTINKQVYEVLCKNPVIYDGTQLFSAVHKNVLASGTGITREALQNMMLALQTQTDQFGEAITINPAKIVIPAGYAMDVYTILYSPTINTAGNTQATNPLYRYKELLEVIEDPTINTLCGGFGKVMPWFLFGAESDTDGIEVDYLDGKEIPNIRRMEVPGQLGFTWDIYLDWGVNLMDYRGIIKNPGVEVASPL